MMYLKALENQEQTKSKSKKKKKREIIKMRVKTDEIETTKLNQWKEKEFILSKNKQNW